jgi:predicted Zn-dependent peptidase
MTFISEKIEKIKGLTLHSIQTEKYKTNTIVLKLKAPLQEEVVTKRAILPYVLQSGTKTYPTVSKLRTYLDELYGASLYVDLAKKGEHHIISIRMEIANEKFLTDPSPLLMKGISLMAEILLSPAIENNMFIRDIVEKEKRTAKQRIQSVFNDKMRYSNLRLIQEMCKEEPYRLHVNGELDDIDSITPEDLYQYYQRVLQEDEIDLYVVGDFQLEEVRDAVSQHFASISERKNVFQEQNQPFQKTIDQVNEVIEEQEVKQGKLNIGYRTNITFSDPDYNALQVFNGIFGGFSHSKLFINVREKQSLAYYAASRVESHKGLLMVMSGIDVKNYKKAVDIINEQMEAMKSGDFTNQEIEQTKAVIRNQILETIDTPYGLVEVLYHNVVAKTKKDVQEWLTGIEQVSREEIIEAAKKVQLDTIYFLKGTEA